MKLSTIFTINIIKSMFVNLYYFNPKIAIRLPILIGRRTKIESLGSRDSISISNNFNGHICFGLNASFSLNERLTYLNIGKNSKILFLGSANFGKGSQVVVNGNLHIGANFYCNANCIINAGKNIFIGDDVLVGWNCTIIDGDGHYIGDFASLSFNEKYDDIFIGNHVWLASNSTILKGSFVNDNSIIGYGSLISKNFKQENILICGANKIVKEGVTWKI